MKSVDVARSRWLMGASITALACCAAPAVAAPTRAGTMIENTASARYTVSGETRTEQSNINKLKVDEIIDPTVTLTSANPMATTPGDASELVRFKLVNSGNGGETFGLTTNAAIGGDDFNPTVQRIILDLNDNGTFEPGVDAVYQPGSNDPTLEPGASVGILVEVATPSSVTDGQRGDIALIATSKTGTGTPGTVFAGLGEGGGNALVGSTGGDDEASGTLQVSAASVGLHKSAVVSNRFNTTAAIPGATITYSIVATTQGSGTVNALEINDSIPAGTTYVAGSLMLGATALSDAADSDAGRFSSNAINVTLGDVPGGQTRTISFKVTINDQ